MNSRMFLYGGNCQPSHLAIMVEAEFSAALTANDSNDTIIVYASLLAIDYRKSNELIAGRI